MRSEAGKLRPGEEVIEGCTMKLQDRALETVGRLVLRLGWTEWVSVRRDPMVDGYRLIATLPLGEFGHGRCVGINAAWWLSGGSVGVLLNTYRCSRP